MCRRVLRKVRKPWFLLTRLLFQLCKPPHPNPLPKKGRGSIMPPFIREVARSAGGFSTMRYCRTLPATALPPRYKKISFLKRTASHYLKLVLKFKHSEIIIIHAVSNRKDN